MLYTMMKAIIENDPLHEGYILYRCAICKYKIKRRKMGEPLNIHSMHCVRCGSKMDLKY